MSIPLQTLALFAVASIALGVTPGPDMLYLMSRSVAQGRRAGFVSLAGIMTGCLGHILAASLGLSSLFLAAPLAYDALRFAGAAYLLYLAWQMVRPGARTALAMTDGAPAPVRHGSLFRQGFLTNLLNPKVALFYLALFPQFVVPEHGSLFLQGLTLGVMQDVIGGVINSGIILVAGSFGGWLAQRPGWARAQNYVLGTIFGGLAVRLVLADRR